ncbi:hypothetical protein ASPCAL10392 [Aspergillus calidoustus]|uniref:Cell wall protein n=1 Tax=Aspergillus calidoustus TaxID=454130 RepID=A0A0U5G8H7_ASPCI|nr:hypothetical protein ASPCAL10392 [Aspergillus calidoustus]
MRSNLLLLAALAGSTLALPTASTTELDARTFGLIGGLIDTINDILHGTSPVNILGGISAEAAVALNGGAIGCKAGSIDVEYRKQLGIWLKTGAGVHIDADLKKSLLAWCEADVSVDIEIDLEIRAQLSFFLPTLAHIAAQKELYVTLDGVFDFAKDIAGVLTIGAQASLEAAIGLLGELDWKIKAGLEFCAAGGILADLDVEIIAALKLWLESKECKLTVELKKTLKLWLEGRIEGDVIELPKLPVGGLSTISLGKSLEVLIEASGALVVSAQASLGAFLQTDIGLEIDLEIRKLLEFCGKGGLAIDIEYEKRVELSLWLASSKCKLTAELKALIAFWLSFGVSAGAEVSIDFSKNILAELTGFITGTIDALLGGHLHGLLSFLLSGEGVLSISIEARAQLAALISGGFGFSIDKHIEIIIIGWLGGCHECCGGKPPVSSTTPTLPSTTPTASPSTTPSTTKTTTTKTDVEPTGTPTTTPGEPEETPCETDTDVEPTGEPTTTKPTEPTETPCETLTTETTISHTESHPTEPTGEPSTTKPGVPTDSHPTEPTGEPSTTKPGVPTDVEPTGEPSETPCETLTTATTISHTETKPPVPTDVEPTESASQPPSTITEPPVPTATSTGGKKTITITKTVGVEYCPPNY